MQKRLGRPDKRIVINLQLIKNSLYYSLNDIKIVRLILVKRLNLFLIVKRGKMLPFIRKAGVFIPADKYLRRLEQPQLLIAVGDVMNEILYHRRYKGRPH